MHQDPTQSTRVYTRSPNLFNTYFALPNGSRCRCLAHLSKYEHWSEFLVHCFAHMTDTLWLCNNFANRHRDQKSFFTTFQSISSIKSVNELQCHSVNVRANCASIILFTTLKFHFHAACIGQHAAARPPWVLMTAGGTHSRPLQLARYIESFELIWYMPCVFIRLYPDCLQTLQLTLRQFDEDCRELKGTDSFLCEEIGRKFWRQRVAFE